MNFGIRANLVQVLQQFLQVLFVGVTLGMMRIVVPALAESEFGVPCGSFMLLVAFVVAFGFVYLHQQGVSLQGIGWIVGVYGFTLGRRPASYR